MTTSPDIVHAAEATTDPARLAAQKAGQPTSPATPPTPTGTIGGTASGRQTHQHRPLRTLTRNRPPVQARPGRRLRGRPAAGADRRHPAAVGLGPGLARRGDRARLLLALRARHHRRLPPVLHPRLVQGQDRPAGRAGHRGQPGHRGPGHHLGLRPPPAPQVQRQGRRPALALAVRRRLEGALQGPGLRAHRLAVRPEPDLAGEVLPRTCSPTGESCASTGWFPGAGRRSPCCSRRSSAACGRCPGRAR